MIETLALLAGLLVAPAAAEAPRHPTTMADHAAHVALPQFTTSVRFANRTPFRRREWGSATVPFPAGTYFETQQFAAVGLPSELVPFGARWPDGSVRYAQLWVQLDLAPGQEIDIVVREQAPGSTPFVVSPWMAAAMNGFSWNIAVGVPNVGIRVAPLRLKQVLHNSEIRKVFWFQGRIPDTDVVYDFWATFLSDQDHAQFELKLISANTGSAQWEQHLDFIDLWTTGLMPLFRGSRRLGLATQRLDAFGPSVVRLLDTVRLVDGQGHEWYGDMVAVRPIAVPDVDRRVQTLMSVYMAPLYGVSLDWRSSGAFGPWGIVPQPPAWLSDGGRAAALASRARFTSYLSVAGHPWDDLPLGLLRNPSFSGDQNDFGVARLVDIFSSGMPDGIEEARFMCLEEANRPVHHREADGSRVTSRGRPDWVAWGGRSHFNAIVCRDRLGKPHPEPFLDPNSWQGRDHQHWSSLTLASAYLLTGSHSLRDELENEAELYLASHTVPSLKPRWATNDIDQPRAVGRTFLSLSWNYLCTGRTDLRDRMRARVVECVRPQHRGYLTNGATVLPLSVVGPDVRIIANHEFWKPWEEALAIVGLDACYRVTGEPLARDLAAVAARNLLLYGWKLDAQENIVATGVRWLPDGAPLSSTQYDDPNQVLWSYGTNFTLWSLPAVKLAIGYAQLLQDPALEQRARTIVQRIYQVRQRPAEGGFDRYTDWEGVPDY